MKRFRIRWSRALTSPLSQVLSQTVGRLGSKTKRRLHSLETVIAAVEAERDRLRKELRDLIHYTDAEIRQLNQTIEALEQERDELQLQLWSIEETEAAASAPSRIDADAAGDGGLAPNNLYVSESSEEETAGLSKQSAAKAIESAIEGALESDSDLSWLRLALVGGHSATRRGVIQELKGRYGLKHCVEIPRMTESNTNRSRVKAKIRHCDLVVIITGYMGHRLTEIVYSLKAADALAGEVLQLSCRGKSGVVREIIKHLGEVQS
ncbi:MAG: hypothetical protein ACFB5Z_01540 [Elainellaceae cyanobacterium]